MAIPDIKQAFIEEMEAQATITAVTTKIAGALVRSWGSEPGYAIVVRNNGSPGQDLWSEVGYFSSRIDLECYGPSPSQANDLWRIVYPTFIPDRSAGQRYAFSRANCKVNWVDLESGPFDLIDEITRLPFCQASLIAVWRPLA